VLGCIECDNCFGWIRSFHVTVESARAALFDCLCPFHGVLRAGANRPIGLKSAQSARLFHDHRHIRHLNPDADTNAGALPQCVLANSTAPADPPANVQNLHITMAMANKRHGI
jgi:hypothetical protein